MNISITYNKHILGLLVRQECLMNRLICELVNKNKLRMPLNIKQTRLIHHYQIIQELFGSPLARYPRRHLNTFIPSGNGTWTALGFFRRIFESRIWSVRHTNRKRNWGKSVSDLFSVVTGDFIFYHSHLSPPLDNHFDFVTDCPSLGTFRLEKC